MERLFEAVKLGDLELPNRVIMAPLTRCRASAGRVPNDLMRDYYVQRAGAGLIFTEATAVTPDGVGYVDTPGIWSREQVDGWTRITQAVHEAGGRIMCQLWHVGRLSHPDFLDGRAPFAPSAIACPGEIRLPGNHHAPYGTPREMTRDEVKTTIEMYRLGAANALEAGFDGVELHGANGYLPDQILRDGTNKRTDEYGGSVENRARFLLEATDALIDVWGAGRVGVHLSPRDMAHHGIADSDPAAAFSYVAEQLGRRKIAFLFTRESVAGGARFSPAMKKAFGGALIANEEFSREQAEMVLENGEAEAVAWGQMFLANPDLPLRFKLDAPLNKPNPATFYAPGAEGYSDYPFLDEDEVEARQSREREAVAA